MFLNSDNHFTARGRLVKDPYITISQETGNSLVSITIAQEHPVKKNESGEKEPVFISYIAIDTQSNKIASRLADYVVKGTLISLEGFHDSYVKTHSNGDREYIETKRILQFRMKKVKIKPMIEETLRFNFKKMTCL